MYIFRSNTDIEEKGNLRRCKIYLGEIRLVEDYVSNVIIFVFTTATHTH